MKMASVLKVMAKEFMLKVTTSIDYFFKVQRENLKTADTKEFIFSVMNGFIQLQ